jgi:hypothetical protein
MSLHQLVHDVFFNLFDLLNARVHQGRVDPEPTIIEFPTSRSFGVDLTRNEHYLEFTSVEVVTDDDLVSITL